MIRFALGLALGAVAAVAATHETYANTGTSSGERGGDCEARILHLLPRGYRVEIWFCWPEER